VSRPSLSTSTYPRAARRRGQGRSRSRGGDQDKLAGMQDQEFLAVGLKEHASYLPVPVRCLGRHAKTRPARHSLAGPRGCSSMAEHQLPKLTVRVRFPSPAPKMKTQVRSTFRTGRPVVIVALALPGLDVGVDRVGYRLVRAARLVLVDHRRPLTVVTHASHQISQGGAAVGRELVAGPDLPARQRRRGNSGTRRCHRGVERVPDAELEPKARLRVPHRVHGVTNDKTHDRPRQRGGA
jgi:hypothetical protein